MKRIQFLLAATIVLTGVLTAFTMYKNQEQEFVSYTVDPAKQDLKLYWKNDQGEILKSIQNLKKFVESKDSILVFAMNAGMYKEDHSPLGLFIQNTKTLVPLNNASGHGNFYLKPNGIFYITTDRKASVCKTENFINAGNVAFATQSGPMLLIDGEIHQSFVKGSTSLNFRNGVGILPNGKALFVMSTREINFYDFAVYFQKAGCTNALYLDGFVSRTYLPEKRWIQTDGNFGVMIGVTERMKKQ